MASAIIIAFFFGPMIVIAGLMPVGRAGPLWWVLLFLAGLAPFGAIVLFNWWAEHWEQQEAIRVALEASRANLAPRVPDTLKLEGKEMVPPPPDWAACNAS